MTEIRKLKHEMEYGNQLRKITLGVTVSFGIGVLGILIAIFVAVL